MSLGAVSFTHIVKAGEPALTALLSLLLLQQRFAAASYLALLPVVGGVALASCTQVDFSWASFCCAMLSNLGSSGRAILAKKVFANAAAVGCDLSPPNLYALLTVVASAAALPLGGPGAPAVLLKLTQSAVWYYLYNEVAYLCLQKLNPVTHAVANTLKRVFIIVAAVLVFRTPLTPLGAAGSVLAILGSCCCCCSGSSAAAAALLVFQTPRAPLAERRGAVRPSPVLSSLLLLLLFASSKRR
ncbi:Phosphate/phosphoenolpyruvate translocator, related [Eimeria tenella]|uniref:Phosphate/phosphoenolpyruvate translocator, related n=1 Tax=Eimeria tenella TaxID=5802 RepID=U6KKI6_EIMTE|nr:Phosphate/phosphoenolpyruvate translocator, related [Eimeria tenella]CDJ38419.1 Phosphate/phosphoenolpyruvate translocator, related [Eimeria tenella]|eukprot:XP_013229257.1 Phosphate/phosphoenolpyruvate translocator, related [Eimeria tenella]